MENRSDAHSQATVGTDGRTFIHTRTCSPWRLLARQLDWMVCRLEVVSLGLNLDSVTESATSMRRQQQQQHVKVTASDSYLLISQMAFDNLRIVCFVKQEYNLCTRVGTK